MSNVYDFTNESEEQELIPEGTYEAILSKAEIKKGKSSGNDYINIEYTIRGDVEQPCKNFKVWDAVGKDKNDPNKFSMIKLRHIVLTQKNVEGYRPKFDSDEELLQFLNKIYLRIKITKEDAKDGFKARNSVDMMGYDVSKAAPKTLSQMSSQTTQPEAGKPDTVDVKDDDLPF